MGFIAFIGLICVLWLLFVLTKNTNENLEQQREILYELRQLNELGQRLRDKGPGQEAEHPASSSPAQPSMLEAHKTEPVNINTADLQSLQSLPGVGKALAQKIIDARPYQSVDALTEISGISQEMFAKLRDLVST